MALRIGTNVAAIAAQHRLDKNFARAEHAMKALASGNRIVRASDDAAGFAISENLKAQRKGISQAQRNSQDAISFIQVAEGSLNEQNNILVRLRELGVQSASDTVSDTEREFLDKEYQELLSEFDHIANTTSYGNNKLLAGDAKHFEFHVGPDADSTNRIQFTLNADARADSIGISGSGVADSDDALDSLQSIDDALVQVADMRATFGASQSRLQIASDNLQTQYENISQAYSNYADADIAKETAELVQANILSDIGVSVLSQANAHPMYAQKLLNNL